MKLTPNSRLWSVLSWYMARSRSYRSLSKGVRHLHKRLILRLKQDHGQLLWDTHHSCPGGEIEHIIDHYAYSGQPHEADNMMQVFKAAFKAAVKEGGLGCNPAEAITFPDITKQGLPVENLVAFVDVAFSKFEWRNAGLCALLIYCVPMPISRVLSLKWSDLDPLLLDITMAGRKYEIDEPLFSLLQEQKGDWDFQQYVIPKEANVPYQLYDMVGLIHSIVLTTDSPTLNLTELFKEGLDEWKLRRLSSSVE